MMQSLHKYVHTLSMNSIRKPGVFARIGHRCQATVSSLAAPPISRLAAPSITVLSALRTSVVSPTAPRQPWSTQSAVFLPQLPLRYAAVPLPLRAPSVPMPPASPLHQPPSTHAPPVLPHRTPIQEPTSHIPLRREAARLIIIRRRKMKKHKRKKLLKRMRFVWAKKALRRTSLKERAFQSEQMSLVAEANKFDARKYVDDLLEKNSTLPLSTVYGGKRLPYFIRLPTSPKFKYPK